MNDNPLVGGAGTITVVGGSSSPGDLPPVSEARRKRDRDETTLPAIDLGAPGVPEDPAVETHYVNESEYYGEVQPESPKSQVQRLLNAKRRRRRLGRHMAQEQVNEDMDDVKKFLSLNDADKEAYLAIYEYDGSSDNIVEGLAKASSLALRVGLAYTVRPKDYDIASMALDMPEVKDGLATIWDCVDIENQADTKFIKMAAAIGHVGDTMMGTAMKLYQGVARAAELRERKEQMERRKAAGVQSVFDQNVSTQNNSRQDPNFGPAPGEPVPAGPIQTI